MVKNIAEITNIRGFCSSYIINLYEKGKLDISKCFLQISRGDNHWIDLCKINPNLSSLERSV